MNIDQSFGRWYSLPRSCIPSSGSIGNLWSSFWMRMEVDLAVFKSFFFFFFFLLLVSTLCSITLFLSSDDSFRRTFFYVFVNPFMFFSFILLINFLFLEENGITFSRFMWKLFPTNSNIISNNKHYFVYLVFIRFLLVVKTWNRYLIEKKKIIKIKSEESFYCDLSERL